MSSLVLAQYRFDNWTTEHGLPQNSVLAIAQTADGYLWLATYNGLVRFDGARFTVFDKNNTPAFKTSRFHDSFTDATGALWLCVEDGGVLRYQNGIFTSFTTAQGWLSCYRGLSRVSKQQLNDYADGKIAAVTHTAFGKADGMLNTDCNGGRQPSGVKTRDGRLWFTTLRPAVAVLDIHMPEMTGFEVARAVQEKRLATRLVILTMYKDEEMFNAAMNIGVQGYVLKDSALAEIVACIKSVAAGQTYVSATLSGLLLNRRQRSAALQAQTPGLNDLTPAERRILKLIAAYKSSKEIADELHIHHRTVDNHRTNTARNSACTAHTRWSSLRWNTSQSCKTAPPAV